MRKISLVTTALLLGCSDSSHSHPSHDASSVSSQQDESRNLDSGQLSDSGNDSKDAGNTYSDAGSESVYEAVVKRMRECAILSREGKYSPLQENFYYDKCYARCLTAAPCEEMKISLCASGRENVTITKCLASCENEYVTCPETLRGGKHCDGIKDCLNGEDEAGCEFFTCKGGQSVRDARQCDGEPDCADGSDELNCFGTILCADGKQPTESSAFECNGSAECNDGSDEIDCMKRGLVFACDDRFIPIGMVCNLEVDCEDGSDEMQGCATRDCGP